MSRKLEQVKKDFKKALDKLFDSIPAEAKVSLVFDSNNVVRIDVEGRGPKPKDVVRPYLKSAIDKFIKLDCLMRDIDEDTKRDHYLDCFCIDQVKLIEPEKNDLVLGMFGDRISQYTQDGVDYYSVGICKHGTYPREDNT